MPIENNYFPNAREFLGETYYVAQNNPQASDENPGTQKRPFKTISRAGSVAEMFDIVMVDEGVYREEVPLLHNGHMYMPESLITFKSISGKKVYLKGSDIFEPEWRSVGDGVFKAGLPEFLFQKGVYNPYEKSCVIDEPGTVRPVKGPELPETLGQIYVEGVALDQLGSRDAVRTNPGSFAVLEDGREVIVHFAGGDVPKGKLVELTVRERCFKPVFSGEVFIQTMGIVVEHAANPGPFCFGRPLTIRKNPGTGITVRKVFSHPGSCTACNTLCQPCYKSKNQPTLMAMTWDPGGPGLITNHTTLSLESEDHGKNWKTVTTGRPIGYQFLDEEKDILIRHYCRDSRMVFEISSDQGKSWRDNTPKDVHSGSYYYLMIKLQDGRILCPYTDFKGKLGSRYRFCTLLGTWRKDLSGIDWESGGSLEVDPKISGAGLDEPHVCQLSNGRVFAILRQGNVLPSQDHPGFPSVKLFSVSPDCGKTWSEARPLTYDDGRYVYSSRSWPDVFRSSKNGRVYVILNIAPDSTVNCEPRSTLHIAELDTERFCVRRNSVAIIETKHPEHHELVRFSNWYSLENRYNGNLLLFMQMHMSEYCFVRKGYDFNVYRYEIELPD